MTNVILSPFILHFDETKNSSKKSRGNARSKQLAMIKITKSDYGGDLLKTRRGRRSGRPLSTRETMHLVLRSTKARGELSFLRPKHDKNVRAIIARFASKFGIRILSIGNSGNHIHLQIKLTNRFTYNSFIRAVTGAIALSVMGRSSADGTKMEKQTKTVNDGPTKKEKFWDRRPFTRIARSFREFVNLEKYVRVNAIEGEGYSRSEARDMVDAEKILWSTS